MYNSLGKLGSFKEVFPDIEVSSDIYEIDRDRITCSGGTAGLDMMLYLIRNNMVRHWRLKFQISLSTTGLENP